MNLRVPCLAFALLSIAATGDPCSDGGSVGTGTGTDAGPNGPVCEVTVGTPCCVAVEQPCSDDNDCCGGNCSGSNGEGGFGGDTSTCGEPVNEGCTAALGSRCNEGQCACASDDDCCVVGSICQVTSLPGASGRRCCLGTGFPCDAPADCCSLTCTGDAGVGQCE
jgi:hypothetical protein